MREQLCQTCTHYRGTHKLEKCKAKWCDCTLFVPSHGYLPKYIHSNAYAAYLAPAPIPTEVTGGSYKDYRDAQAA